MTEIETFTPSPDLRIQMDYAKAVASAALLPVAYRNKPADIMLAMGLGQAMGLSPAESLYRIDVIQGKPAASAELIASNVRKAGHKLRMAVSENPPSATCTIIRADDPDEPISITRDMTWARQMGLLEKDNYKKQPSTMLAWRAISACARLACSEALYGVNYTADEMFDMSIPGEVVERPASPLGAALAGQTSGSEEESGSGSDPDGSPVVVAGSDGSSDPEPVDADVVEDEDNKVTAAQLRLIGRLMGKKDGLGITDRDEALGYVAAQVGRPVESRSDLSKSEAKTLIDALEADVRIANEAGA